MSPYPIVSALIASGLALGCGEEPAPNTSWQRAAVVGGEASGEEDNAVIRIIARQPATATSEGCTGTLVAPNLVLTALHCVAVFDFTGEFRCRSDGSLAPPDLGFGWIGETLDVADIKIVFGTKLSLEPAANVLRVLGSGATQVCADDIALVLLDRDLPSPGLPLRLERPVVEGEYMTVIGYGLNDLKNTPRARRSHMPVLSVGPDEPDSGEGTVLTRSFILGDGPCRGENGAPAVSDETGAVTGVYSITFGGNCAQPGTRHSFTKLSPHASLFARAFELAEAKPMLESLGPPPAPANDSSSCTLRAGRRAQIGHAWAGVAFGAMVSLLTRRRGRARSRLR